MKEVICIRDYYNNNGVLLAAKGTLISEQKLRNLNRLYPENNREAEECRKRDPVIHQAEIFKNNHGNVKIPLLNRASTELIEVLSESKQKPWNMHINALSSYLDCLYTHSVEVALVSLMIAIGLGYPASDLMDLGLGAILHDVGKILIPRQIVLEAAGVKNGKIPLSASTVSLGGIQRRMLFCRIPAGRSFSSIMKD